MAKRVLSGIRATGRLHLGNYLGAVKGMLALQDKGDYEPFYMVADLHAITTPYEKEDLRKNAREVVKDYLAAGLDPEKSVLFLQSDVPEHLELSYLFSTQITVARLSHLPTYKDKAKQYPENNTLALLYYPVLMAADILSYKAEKVPVGIDQEPHLEVARELARKLNQHFGLNLPEPKRFGVSDEHRFIPSLTGEGKMSKSIEGSYINLVDSKEVTKEKIFSIPTDTGKGKIEKKKYKGRLPTYEEIKEYISENNEVSLGVATLMELVSIFQGKEKRKMYEEMYTGEGIKYSELKKELSEAIYEELKPIQERRGKLDDDYINEVLEKGANRAREEASKTLSEVKEAMGIV